MQISLVERHVVENLQSCMSPQKKRQYTYRASVLDTNSLNPNSLDLFIRSVFPNTSEPVDSRR